VLARLLAAPLAAVRAEPDREAVVDVEAAAGALAGGRGGRLDVEGLARGGAEDGGHAEQGAPRTPAEGVES